MDFYKDNKKFIKMVSFPHSSLKRYCFENLYNKFSDIFRTS